MPITLMGGAVGVTDEPTYHNLLHLRYEKYGIRAKGIWFAIWMDIAKLHPHTKAKETCTPCFDKRNIHFCVNKCGFHIVE